MTQAGLIVYFIIMAISHVCFGLFSCEHRFNKWVTGIGYALFFGIYVGITFLPIDFGFMFLIVLALFLITYPILAKGSILKNLFLITSYLTFIIIFNGVTLSLMLIDCSGAIAIRWVLLIIGFGVLESAMYFYLIPQFRKAEKNIPKGWVTLLVGDILFLILFFMQIFYPFKINSENLWGLILFLLSAAIYFFVFVVVFKSLATTKSYNDEIAKNAGLQEMAIKDSLTDLYNRNYFQLYSEGLKIDNSLDDQKSTVVVVMDINRFKSINDTFGHSKGDEILKQVANQIHNIFIQENYLCFRFGGDEFIVIGTDVKEEVLINKIDVLKTSILKELNVSISAGYNYVDFKNIDAIDTAFKNADKSMYQEKLK